MIRMTAFTLLTLLPFASAALAQGRGGDDGGIFPYPMSTTTLDNGLKIVTIPFDSPGIIAYYTVVRTGSRNETEPGKSGFAHFFEHMMFRGTEKYPAAKFNDILKAIGADNNAYTSDDETVYHTFASSDALETLMDIESDRFMNLKYSEEDFKTEAGAILGEYNKNSSNPFQAIIEKIRDTAYTSHTYKHTTMGFLRDIKNMPNQYKYSLTFFDRWYRPENCVLLIVGDVKHDRVVELARRYYGPWKHGTFTLDVPAEPPQTVPVTVNLPWKAKTLPIVALAWHGPAFSDKSPDMAAINLLALLTFGETSPLYRKLVVDDQSVEFVEGSMEENRDPGLFYVFSRVKDPRNIPAVRDAVLAAIEEAKTKPVDAGRLASVKSHMKYDFAMGLDNADHVANGISHYIKLTNDPASVNRFYALYDRITPDDLMAAAKKYFTAAGRTVLTLTHEENKQ